MFAITGVNPELTAVKPEILPEPFAPNPIAVLSFVHAKVAPDTGLAKVVAPPIVLLQMEMFGIDAAVTVGVGLAVIVKVLFVPTQPLAVGVTVIVAATGAEPELVAVKFEIFPEPLAERPIDVLLFVHVKVEPDTGPAKVVAPPIALLQTERLGMDAGSTVATGFAVIVKLKFVPVQPLATGVTVIVSMIGAVVGFFT